jgi:hypothetical protein
MIVHNSLIGDLDEDRGLFFPKVAYSTYKAVSISDRVCTEWFHECMSFPIY